MSAVVYEMFKWNLINSAEFDGEQDMGLNLVHFLTVLRTKPFSVLASFF